MPRVPFTALPDMSRVWVFGSDRRLQKQETAALLSAVDDFLDSWTAHGLPLTCARDWRHDRFLTIGVDQREAHASGCSIDGLYRSLRKLEQSLGFSLLGGGRVFYSDRGVIVCVDREGFSSLAAGGQVSGDTVVFDLTCATLSEWYDRFESSASRTWHRELMPQSIGAR
jgi:hypothetical protein